MSVFIGERGVMIMEPFIHENFLLQTSVARTLYHEYARDLPVIDYHCHLPPRQIAEDTQFQNASQIWLYGDHYKWRALRTAGVDEKYITGNASDREKFHKWAVVTPQTLRNPLYHWTHLELNRPFGINDRLFSPETEDYVWAKMNEKLEEKEFSARGIMKQMKVELVCTTDDPTDSLEYHRICAAAYQDGLLCARVLPTFRPDRAMNIQQPDIFNAWVDKLELVSGVNITDFSSFLNALHARYAFFHENGCRLSDHGLGMFPLVKYNPQGNPEDAFTRDGVDATFRLIRTMRGSHSEYIPSPEEAEAFSWRVLYECGRMNHEFGWTQQFHFGAMRNNNTRMFNKLGADAGYDSIADGITGLAMSRFLDSLDRENALTRTILYNLNPAHNHLVGTMLGNFQDGITPGKIQFGSGWWFLDQKYGMEEQINVLSSLGLLRYFTGMLTDSRSFLSYTRHEYFRRILCNMLGNDVEAGILPRDEKMLGELVSAVSYGNASSYFQF